MSTLFFESINLEPNDTLVLSIDFDGCTDTPEARAKLIEHFVQYCKTNPQYKNIYIAIGSLRQSAPSDLNNAQMNSRHFNGELHSCSVLLGDFVEQLKARLAEEITDEKPPEVIKMELLMADIYHDLPEGETLKLINSKDYSAIYNLADYRSIGITSSTYQRNISELSADEYSNWYYSEFDYLTEREQDEYLKSWTLSREEFENYHEWRDDWQATIWDQTNLNNKKINALSILGPFHLAHSQSFEFDDVSKCLTLYNLFQHMYRKTAKPFDLIQVDDRTDLLGDIEAHYLDNQHQIPSGCTYRGLEWLNYPGFDVTYTENRPLISGTGTPNPNFANTVKYIAKDSMVRNITSQLALALNIPKPKPAVTYRGLLAPKPRRNVGIRLIPQANDSDSKASSSGMSLTL